MIEAIDIVEALPVEIESVLNASDFFADIPIAVVDRGDLVQQLDRKQNVLRGKGEKRGVAVFILQLEADDASEGTQYGPMELYPSVQIVEAIELNMGQSGTGKSARKVGRQIRDELKLYAAHGMVTNFLCEKPFMIPLPMSEKGMIGYQVNFRCRESDHAPQRKVAFPYINRTDLSAVTITCTTDGATIFFTTDGSLPAERNPTATAYTEAIALTTGTVLRARAYKAGAFGSDTAMVVT